MTLGLVPQLVLEACAGLDPCWSAGEGEAVVDTQLAEGEEKLL